MESYFFITGKPIFLKLMACVKGLKHQLKGFGCRLPHQSWGFLQFWMKVYFCMNMG